MLAVITLIAAGPSCTTSLSPQNYRFNPDIAVQPVFANYADWNSYVLNDGTTAYNGSGLNCTSAGVSRSARCQHAAELRKVVLPKQWVDCKNVIVGDALGLFDWVCDAGGDDVTVYSVGLKDGKGLRDLIDGSAQTWRLNSVVLSGVLSAATPAAVWWPNNPVLPLPLNSGVGDPVVTLSTPKAVYVAAVDQPTRGYNVVGNRISLVTTGTARLRYAGTATLNCNATTGTTSTPNVSALLCVGGSEFTWLEASVDDAGAGLSNLVYLVGSNFVRINSTFLDGGTLALNNLKAPRLAGLRANDGGLKLTTVQGGVFAHLQLTQSPLELNGSNNNVFERGLISGGDQGVALTTSISNTFSRFTIFGTTFDGVRVGGTSNFNNVFGYVTIANAGGNGLTLAGGGGHILHDVVTVNSGSTGLMLTGTTSLSQIVTMNNAGDGIYVGSPNNKFSGALLVGTNGGSDCTVDGAQAAPGLDNACAGQNLSTALTTVPGLTSAGAFRGKITTTDSANASNTLGTAIYPASPRTFDFVDFTKISDGAFDLFRAWSLDGSAYPNADHRGRWTTGPGRIWDLGLASTGNVLRTTSDDGVSPNAVPTSGAACPTWLHGSRAITDASANIAYLTNAYEVMNDRVGNEDGLCESGEVCVATPNFGAYQGDGDDTPGTCKFTDGAVTGVTMRFLPFNGR